MTTVAFLLAGCASDGRELAEAHDWQTTTTRPPPPTSAPLSQESISGIALSSPDFEPGAENPPGMLCSGDNKFPNLEWTEVPPDTVEVALTLSDQTDPKAPLLLWLMGGIDPNLGRLDSGFLPSGAYETLNDYGQPGWGNPCLETFSSGQRDLQFRLYVLDRPADVVGGAPGNEAWDSVTAGAIESATLLVRVDSSS